MQNKTNEFIDPIFSGLALELNHTMMLISGYSEILCQRCNKNDESSEYLRRLSLSTHKAADLIHQLYDYDSSHLLNLKYIYLNEAISDIEPLMRSAIRNNIEIKRYYDGSSPRVEMNIEKLRQVLFGLVLNAQDAIRHEGILTIELKTVTLERELVKRLSMAEGDYARLTISDNGTGIEASVMPNIFDPFFTTKNRTTASGIGLSTISGIVKQYRGNIIVNSTAGKGTSVSIILPLQNKVQNISQKSKTNISLYDKVIKIFC